jgi:hypothetical protein
MRGIVETRLLAMRMAVIVGPLVRLAMFVSTMLMRVIMLMIVPVPMCVHVIV